VDFHGEYLWNGSSNHQAKDGVINYGFFPRSIKTTCSVQFKPPFQSTNEKMTLTFYDFKIQ